MCKQLLESAGIANKKMTVIVRLLTIISFSTATLAVDSSIRYVLQPMDMSSLGTNAQYFDIYITSNNDARVSITVPGNTTDIYSISLELTMKNRWSWKKHFALTDDLLTNSVRRGFHLTTSQPVNAHVLQYMTNEFQYLIAYTALPVTSSAKHFMISPQLVEAGGPGYEQILVISSGQETRYTVYDHINTNELSSETVTTYDSAQITSTDDSFVGSEVTTTLPVAVFAGNNKAQIPNSNVQLPIDGPVFLQTPPISDLGKLYAIGPIPKRGTDVVAFSVLVTFPEGAVTIEIYSVSGHTSPIEIKGTSTPCSISYVPGHSTINCNDTPKGGHVEILNLIGDLPIVMKCSKSCFPTLLKHHDLSGNYQPAGYMSLVAPLSVLPFPLRFVLPMSEIFYILDDAYVVISLAGSTSGLTIDKWDITLIDSCNIHVVQSWSVISCLLTPGLHVIDHVRNDVTMSVHVHVNRIQYEKCTTCYSSSYGFPAYYPSRISYTKGGSIPHDDNSVEEKPEKHMRGVVAEIILANAVSAGCLAVVLALAKQKGWLSFVKDLIQNRTEIEPEPELPPSPESCGTSHMISPMSCAPTTEMPTTHMRIRDPPTRSLHLDVDSSFGLDSVPSGQAPHPTSFFD